MKPTINVIALFLITLVSYSSFAQDSTKTTGKVKEYVVSLSSLSPMNIGLRYKQKLIANTFFKVGLINVNAGNSRTVPEVSTSYANESTNFSVGAELGLEFRKKLSDNFWLFHGPSLSYTYNINIYKTENPTIPEDQRKKASKGYTASIPYSIGILFRLTGPFLMSAEITPAISYRYSKLDNVTKTYTPSIGFTNYYGFISLVYRIARPRSWIGTPSF